PQSRIAQCAWLYHLGLAKTSITGAILSHTNVVPTYNEPESAAKAVLRAERLPTSFRANDMAVTSCVSVARLDYLEEWFFLPRLQKRASGILSIRKMTNVFGLVRNRTRNRS
ncbi:hypothetical protein JMJ78_0000906, partial [Colletotrichum scovillei]